MYVPTVDISMLKKRQKHVLHKYIAYVCIYGYSYLQEIRIPHTLYQWTLLDYPLP